MQSSAASLVLKGFKSPVDATAVKKLKDAGAIVVGQTNMDEMGMGSFGLQGYNKRITKNAIDDRYTAGGSSAGSATATKAYTALSALGTDTGGSVNYPAHCAGLFSLKPSFGRVSRFGQIFYSSSNETTGPMSHSITDVHTLFGKKTHLFSPIQTSSKDLTSTTRTALTSATSERLDTLIAL